MTFNEANAIVKGTDDAKMGGLVIHVPFGVCLEKIQGIPHDMVVNFVKES